MSPQQYTAVQGIDYVLPAPPPLTPPPLSLLSEARLLIDLEGVVSQRQAAVDKSVSAAQQLENFDRLGVVGDEDQPGDVDTREDMRKALQQQLSEWEDTIASYDTAIKELMRWEGGFVYLGELNNFESTTTWQPGVSGLASANTKMTGSNQDNFKWYDPFVAVSLDSRSAFGWPNVDMADRVRRASRALRAHESWQVEREFWNGAVIPTNWHLTASPNSPQSSAHRTLAFPFPNPQAAPGTVLGTVVGMAQSLAALDHAIADADAGAGMIHATPYLVQKWTQTYQYLRDQQGNIRTVNNNLLVPGYGYPGTGPDQASRTVSDGVTTLNSTTVTSATAAFTGYDIGRPINTPNLPAGTVILSVTNATTVVVSNPATAGGSAQTLTLPGIGGTAAASAQQWAYATDMMYRLQGDVHTYPLDLREESPALTVNNLVEARAERVHAVISNQLVRACVLVDTTQT